MISVIVPVYNIENFIDRCVKSLIHQSYKDIEIILVDDGSTDSSKAKCDEWEQKDDRIIVIHKENGGLSSARNAGLQIAKGEYISYVDGDDYIDSNAYEKALRVLEEVERLGEPADLLIFRYRKVINGSIEMIPFSEKVTTFTGPELCKEHVYKKNYDLPIAVWTKLYRRELVEDLSFPEGRVWEDIVYNAQTYLRVKKAVLLDDALYNYTYRSTSISKTAMSMEKLQNLYDQYIDELNVFHESTIGGLYENCLAWRYIEIAEMAMVEQDAENKEFLLACEKQLAEEFDKVMHSPNAYVADVVLEKYKKLKTKKRFELLYHIRLKLKALAKWYKKKKTGKEY